MPDLSDEIEDVAEGPKSASGDAGSFEQHPLPDLIKADQYLKGTTGLGGTNDNGGPKSGWGRLRTARAILPGTHQ